MRLTLKWLLLSLEAPAIWPDSQSILKAIQVGFAHTSGLSRMLDKRTSKTTPIWTPCHHGISGNEEADACSKLSTAITDVAPQPVSFATGRELILRTLMDPRPSHCRTKVVYTKTFS